MGFCLLSLQVWDEPLEYLFIYLFLLLVSGQTQTESMDHSLAFPLFDYRTAASFLAESLLCLFLHVIAQLILFPTEACFPV